MNEALFNLGFDEDGETSSKNMLISRGKKKQTKNKTSKLINRERKGNPKTYLQYKA